MRSHPCPKLCLLLVGKGDKSGWVLVVLRQGRDSAQLREISIIPGRIGNTVDYRGCSVYRSSNTSQRLLCLAPSLSFLTFSLLLHTLPPSLSHTPFFTTSFTPSHVLHAPPPQMHYPPHTPSLLSSTYSTPSLLTHLNTLSSFSVNLGLFPPVTGCGEEGGRGEGVAEEEEEEEGGLEGPELYILGFKGVERSLSASRKLVSGPGVGEWMDLS